MGIVPEVSGHDDICPTGDGGCDLHGVFEVREREVACIQEALCGCRSDADKTGEVQKKIPGRLLSSSRRDDVVEIRKRVPGHKGTAGLLFEEIDKNRGRLGMRLPIQSQIDQDIRIEEEDHR